MTGESHTATSLWKHVDTLTSAASVHLFTTTCALVLLLKTMQRADQTLSKLPGQLFGQNNQSG